MVEGEEDEGGMGRGGSGRQKGVWRRREEDGETAVKKGELVNGGGVMDVGRRGVHGWKMG